jgi:crotonobetainyl-CoA:carnitine CoA-transferase CaiB-like acyl-CoA transferase
MLNKRGGDRGDRGSTAGHLAETHWWERGVFQRVEDPHYGTLTLQAPPWKMSRTPPRVKWACRPVGADNAAVYARYLGLSPSELAALRQRGVV